MRNEERGDAKQKKSHRERKNYRGQKDYTDRKQARNAARPKQRFLGVDEETGLGLGWARP
jgi:hypothetical protein